VHRYNLAIENLIKIIVAYFENSTNLREGNVTGYKPNSNVLQFDSIFMSLDLQIQNQQNNQKIDVGILKENFQLNKIQLS